MDSSRPPKYEDAIEMYDPITPNNPTGFGYREQTHGSTSPSAPLIDSINRRLEQELDQAFGDIKEGNGIKIVKNPTKKTYGTKYIYMKFISYNLDFKMNVMYQVDLF